MTYLTKYLWITISGLLTSHELAAFSLVCKTFHSITERNTGVKFFKHRHRLEPSLEKLRVLLDPSLDVFTGSFSDAWRKRPLKLTEPLYFNGLSARLHCPKLLGVFIFLERRECATFDIVVGGQTVISTSRRTQPAMMHYIDVEDLMGGVLLLQKLKSHEVKIISSHPVHSGFALGCGNLKNGTEHACLEDLGLFRTIWRDERGNIGIVHATKMKDGTEFLYLNSMGLRRDSHPNVS